MSLRIPTNATSSGVFQSQFGSPPGSHDPKAECEKWQQLCDKLIADYQRVREELGKARLERVFAEWDRDPIQSLEEVLARIDRTTTFDQLIEEIERDAEQEA
jgi:hypothetical protein